MEDDLKKNEKTTSNFFSQKTRMKTSKKMKDDLKKMEDDLKK